MPKDGKDNFTLYESDILRSVTGDTLRPGGFYLTDLGVTTCGFLPGAKILDVGCGSGVTVERFVSKYRFQAAGIDSSQLLLAGGRRRNPDLVLIHGQGEDLPFSDNSLDGVFAECALSVMADLDQVLKEIFRVLKPGGRLVINDVYARDPDGFQALLELGIDSCIRRALPKEQWLHKLAEQGDDMFAWTDHTNLLTQLAVDLIMAHGSLQTFWLKASPGSCPGSADPARIQAALKQARMGYFQLITLKRGYCS